MSTQENRPAYHHGDLRRAALEGVRSRIIADGLDAVTIRGIAAEVGVTHTAINHVFGSRKGLLTAFAVEGFDELAARLQGAKPEGLRRLGLAYVRFGLEHPAHFAVMFDAELVGETEEFQAASDRTWSLLRGGMEEVDAADSASDSAAAMIAAWGLVHGIVTLRNSGALGRANICSELDDDDILELADRATGMLFQGRS